VLRKTDPNRARSFRVPAVWLIGGLTIAGCLFLFLNLPSAAMLFLPGWSMLGLLLYSLFSRDNSRLASVYRSLEERRRADYRFGLSLAMGGAIIAALLFAFVNLSNTTEGCYYIGNYTGKVEDCISSVYYRLALSMAGLFVLVGFFLAIRPTPEIVDREMEVVDDVAGEETMVPIHPPHD
jgi:hypothetical protein